MATIGKVLTKIFGSRNDRLLKRYRATVVGINALEPKIQAMTDEQLRARTSELRAGLTSGKLKSADVMSECFAIIRESMDRNIGIRSIFNPEEDPLMPKFDPDQLDDEMLNVYDSVQRHMISTGADWKDVPIPPKLYEAVRKIYPESRPPFRCRPFDVQLIGGLVLYEGKIAEMATGEGKTFVAPLACFMRVLEGFHCHVVTVNDYLVRRDANWVRPAFENLGISIGFIQADLDPGGEHRRKMYECDITYGTNSEFGFDYLRDNMKERFEAQVQGHLDFAIVDEVDSILIDEARTPLIISGPAHDDAKKYQEADNVSRKVIELHKPYGAIEKECDQWKRSIKAAEGDEDKASTKEEKEAARKRAEEAEKALEAAEAKKEGLTAYYEVEWDRKSVHLTHEGIAAAQEAAGVGSFYVGSNMEWPHLMEQSLRAHVVYEKDKEYVVERSPRTGEVEVIIVDEYTGRKMVGRQWSDGLHQAVEAKERVKIKQETQTMATITLQNFFKLYKTISGMTGTAQTEAEEFNKIYKLEVVTIPTNRDVIREDHEDRIYRTEPEKWEAIIEEIKEFSDKGRPVLVGTTSVEKSERLSKMLTQKYGIQHEVLNAKQHEREANIVAVAGQQHKNSFGQMVGNVTIATNMAGRGTDIKLSKDSHGNGGLHVIGTERHTSRRIDNQLRGRSGRQGDPGSSRFYVSLQDDLLKMFMPEWTINVFKKIGMEYGEALESGMLTRNIIKAQKKVEERNFLARKNLLEYDEVMDHQRTTFYGMRQQVLEGRDIASLIWEMIGQSIEDAVDKYVVNDYVAATIAEWARQNFEVAIDAEDLKGLRKFIDIEDYIKSAAKTDVETSLAETLKEFVGEDTEDSADWDLKGLQSWAMTKYRVNLSVSQLKRMTATEIEHTLKEAALTQIGGRDCAGITKYLEPKYALNELCQWAYDKFDVKVTADELIEDVSRNRPKPAADIISLIQGRARDAYGPRELEYPIDHTLSFAFGDGSTPASSPAAVDYIRAWAMQKYLTDLPAENVREMSVRQLRDALVGLQEKYVKDGELERTVDDMIRLKGSPLEDLAKTATARFSVHLPPYNKYTEEVKVADLKAIENPEQLKTFLMNKGKAFFRRELTGLEQFVLISIFDNTWKDHLYAMDMLKASIGLQAFAEKDPRIQYKKEGYRYFEEMMAGVRDKVTDLIFRARLGGKQEERKSAYQVTEARHDAVEGYGVGETVQPDEQVASAGGEAEATATVTKPIQREEAKVGRNDPCPCGSGKKYKKCHGAHLPD